MKIIIYFFNQILESRETQTGVNLTIIFGMQYWSEGNWNMMICVEFDFVFFVISGYNAKVCGIRNK